jgi:hypothetical protein
MDETWMDEKKSDIKRTAAVHWRILIMAVFLFSKVLKNWRRDSACEKKPSCMRMKAAAPGTVRMQLMLLL